MMSNFILLMTLASSLNSFACDSYVEIPKEYVEALKNEKEDSIKILESDSNGDIRYLMYGELYLEGIFRLVSDYLYACEVYSVFRFEPDGSLFVVYRQDVLS